MERQAPPDRSCASWPDQTQTATSDLNILQVTQAAANIVRLRPPSVYKGKGIRIEGTSPRTKPGKRK